MLPLGGRPGLSGPLRVWLVDDGSRNRAALLAVYEHWAERGWDVRLLDANAGKRAAQDEGVRRGTGELIVLMDSDTVLARDAIRQAADHLRRRPGGGRLRQHRGPERAHQPAHPADPPPLPPPLPGRAARPGVLHLAAVLLGAAYRRSLLDELWEGYLGQTFAGVRCTNGDDLHLTNLVLATGRQVLFEPRAIASTSVPRSLGQYLRQQLRWNRSFYRELRWTFSGIRSRHPYLALDVLARPCCPCCWRRPRAAVSEGLLAGWEVLATDLSLALAMLIVTAGFLLAHGASVPFLLLYGPLHVALLVPVRVYALVTLASSLGDVTDRRSAGRSLSVGRRPTPSPQLRVRASSRRARAPRPRCPSP